MTPAIASRLIWSTAKRTLVSVRQTAQPSASEWIELRAG